jgi:G3E family GTPase
VTPRIPSLVIGGYLGAGKTTLVNHLLRHADGKRLAIMVNDFGEISIDADLIVSQDGNVLTLAGGCVCCSVGSDLMSALIDLGERTPAPDMVLIETSGVALPAAVARSARLAPGIGIDAVVVLVDAETVRARAGDPYVGDTVCRQLQEADLLILNKLDLIDATALASLQDWLAEQAPQARILHARESQVPAELILGHHAQAEHHTMQGPDHSTVQPKLAQRPPLSEVARSGRIGPAPVADTHYESARFTLPTPLDTSALAQALVAIRPGLLRFKGVMVDTQRGAVSVQGVGPRVSIEPAPQPAARALHEGEPGQLVVIGRAGSLDHDAMASAIEGAAGVSEK